eukprot:158891_1
MSDIICNDEYLIEKWSRKKYNFKHEKKKKFDYKREIGKYYRWKENKTWKWKLRKRRRSKRRILYKIDDDALGEFDSLDFCKMVQLDITQNKYYSKTIYYALNDRYIYEDVRMATCLFRITVECSTCYSLIYISDNQMFLQRSKDATGHRIYHYSVETDKINANNMKSYHFICGQSMRIFCNYCFQNKLVNCCFTNCRIKDISFSRMIVLDDIHYLVCDNHKRCELCNKQFSYNHWDWWIINEYKLNQCDKCNKYVCDDCVLHGICIICIYQNHFNILFKILDNILDIQAIEIIKDYCNGNYSVQCCSISDCKEWIHIKNISILSGDSEYYSYIATDYAVANAVNICGQKLIIFCSNCTMHKLNRCRWINWNENYKFCPNYTTSNYNNTYCQIHPVCYICNIQCVQDEINKCLKCDEYICIWCAVFDGVCKQCVEKTEFTKIQNILYDSIGHILNISLTNIIARHCAGFFKIKCCNLYGCNHDIIIQNVSSLIEYVDINYQQIYFYRATDYALKNSVYIYGYKLIIFCSKCTAKKLKKCKYHRFSFNRSYGNDIYNKQICYNFEAGHIICQIHKNHRKHQLYSKVELMIKRHKAMEKKRNVEGRKKYLASAAYSAVDIYSSP